MDICLMWRLIWSEKCKVSGIFRYKIYLNPITSEMSICHSFSSTHKRRLINLSAYKTIICRSHGERGYLEKISHQQIVQIYPGIWPWLFPTWWCLPMMSCCIGTPSTNRDLCLYTWIPSRCEPILSKGCIAGHISATPAKPDFLKRPRGVISADWHKISVSPTTKEILLQHLIYGHGWTLGEHSAVLCNINYDFT